MEHVRPLIFTWPEGLVFWLVLAWSMYLENRQMQRNKQHSGAHAGVDKYSGVVISIGSFVLQVAAMWFAFNASTVASPALREPLYLGGVTMIVAGMLLRMHCWRVLGRFFTHTVTITSNHKVVEDGAYQWVRHPSYLGALMANFGWGVATGNYASMAIMLVGFFAIYAYRIGAEESALEAALGSAYTSFKQSRKRLLPFVY